jgi:hypothetical protein
MGGAAASAGTPLDVLDPSPRDVLVEVENSSDLSVVGASFGPPVAATYSASRNVGTLVIPVSSHEAMRAGFLTPIPGTFTPIVIEIDLTTLAATSQTASGSLQSGPVGMAFVQNPLATTTTGGFITGGDIFTPIFCTSQAEVDDACLIVPAFCNSICVLVPGAPYDEASGKVNLVGSETQQGCDGAICSGPFTLFTGNGDLRLTELSAPPLPALGGEALLVLVTLMVVTAGYQLHLGAGARCRARSS